MRITRRGLLAGAVTTLGGAACVASSSTTGAPPAGRRRPSPGQLPAPADSGIDHVVLVMMENRSFDHLLGWAPGADGRQSGLTYRDRHGLPHGTWHLADFQGCGHPDPDHTAEGGRVALAGGRCDGWLRAGSNDPFAIGYYLAADLDFYRRAVADWTVCDRWFAATMGPTYPNRLYQHAGRTDRLTNTLDTCELPTTWDRLAAAGLRGTYYFCDSPFTALWGARYAGISRPYAQFLADCAAGTLPEVAFVDPAFGGAGRGTSAADHPAADIRAGQRFLAEVYAAVVAGPAWGRTLLVITYDQWGGFFDHVAPAEAPDTDPGTALRGFRVPALVISPRARRGAVAHAVLDHTSVLRTIAWRWGLAPLGPRDAAAGNLAELLDFDAPPRLHAPRYPVAPAPAPAPCPGAGDGDDAAQAMRDKAAASGFTLPSTA